MAVAGRAKELKKIETIAKATREMEKIVRVFIDTSSIFKRGLQIDLLAND